MKLNPKSTWQFAVVFFLWGVTALTLISSNWDVTTFLGDHTVQIMFAFLLLGFYFYFLNIKLPLLHSFACAGVLCLFLKSAGGNTLTLPKIDDNTKLSVAHINVSSVGNHKDFSESIMEQSLDVLSFQEVTPNWSLFLQTELREKYPYNISHVRIDPFGMAIYSKHPIKSTDTLWQDDQPLLAAKLEVSGKHEVLLLSTMLPPGVNQHMANTQSKHLSNAANYLENYNGTELVLGEFNMVYWSNKMRDFRNRTRLKNSRVDMSNSLFNISYDHIFYSDDLQCIAFKELSNDSGVKVGISGHFQF